MFTNDGISDTVHYGFHGNTGLQAKRC